MRSPRIGIIGAGIGGLAAAVALRARGVDAEVFEQASHLGEVGAGVSLTLNSIQLIDRLDLMPLLDRTAVALSNGMQLYRSDGTHIGGSKATGVGRNIHRADLIEVFHVALGDGRLHLSKRLIGVSTTDDGCELRFSDGDIRKVDGLVGADGIHSAVRKGITRNSEPLFSGMIAYRGLVSARDLPGWRFDEASMYLGEGRHFLTFPVRGGTLVNFVAFVPTDDQMRESWSAPGDPETLRAEFAGWAPELQQLTRRVDRTFRWGLYDRDPLRRWTKGRATLLGDAAHAMLPHAGQGANQSIEDALALAVCLEDRSPAEVPDAFRDYEEARRVRTSTIQLFARRLGQEYDRRTGHDAAELRRRDDRLAANGDIEAWIKGHDAELEANVVRSGVGRRDLPPVIESVALPE